MKRVSTSGHVLLAMLAFSFGLTSYAEPVDLVKLFGVHVVGVAYDKTETKKMTPEQFQDFVKQKANEGCYWTGHGSSTSFKFVQNKTDLAKVISPEKMQVIPPQLDLENRLKENLKDAAIAPLAATYFALWGEFAILQPHYGANKWETAGAYTALFLTAAPVTAAGVAGGLGYILYKAVAEPIKYLWHLAHRKNLLFTELNCEY